MNRTSLALLLALHSLGCDGSPDPGTDGGTPEGCEEGPIPELTTEPIAGSPFSAPIYVTQAPGRPEALFVVEQGGRIQLVIGSEVTTFLDLSAIVLHSGEQGLLGLAFDPDYASSGRFFVYYTPRARGENVIAEYHRSEGDQNVASPTEIARLWVRDDPEGNHNGGNLQFGPDGYLYAGTGDGGGGGDRHGEIGNALDLTSDFGKILRLDVDAADEGYAADGNPFPSSPLVWAYGLRNPWRWSFDREHGHLYLGDVGQNAYEEIDFLDREAEAGANFGWRAYEGDEVFDTTTQDLVTSHTAPIYVIDRGASDPILRNACAIVGGYVYRGSAIPALRGVYLFGDACSRDVAAFRYCPADGRVRGVTRVAGLEGRGSNLSSFGEDLSGELYITYVGTGEVLRIVTP